MNIRRYLTIAGLGLAVIRPTLADEPGVVRVIDSNEHLRPSGRIPTPVVGGGMQAPAIPPPVVMDSSIRGVNAPLVTDFPPHSVAPGKVPSTMPVEGSVSGPASAQAPLTSRSDASLISPQLPPAVPKLPGPPLIPAPGEPTDVTPSPVVPPGDREGLPILPAPPEIPPPPLAGPSTPDEPGPAIPPPPSPFLGGESTDVPTPVVPDTLPSPLPPAAEAIPPEAFGSDLGAGALTDSTSFEALATQGAFATPEVFGDSLGRSTLRLLQRPPQPPPPLPRPPIPPRPPSPFEPVLSAAFVPSIQNIKLSENQSPAPRDRLIYQFNFYNNVNGSINRRFLSPISNIGVYRHIFGVEKTFFNQMTSVGVRLPLNTVTADSPLPNVGQTETALGNLEIFTKYVLYSEPAAGRLLSTGFAISPNTGPKRFAGANYLPAINNTTIQPFVGGIYTAGRFFAQGFTSIEVPFAEQDVTILYNDYAIGYFLFRSADPNQFLTGITPTFEVHVNTPLNHRGVRIDDPLGIPDFVNLTYGTAFDFGRRTRFLAALVTPVTGPQPFDLEVIASLNIYY